MKAGAAVFVAGVSRGAVGVGAAWACFFLGLALRLVAAGFAARVGALRLSTAATGLGFLPLAMAWRLLRGTLMSVVGLK